MLPAPRPFQPPAVDYVRDREATGKKRICLWGPTGSGKTWVTAKLLLDPLPQILFTYRRVLVDQLAGVLTEAGIPFGFRARGYPTNSAAPIQLALYQSENARAFRSDNWARHEALRVHVDEGHAIRGEVAQTILGDYWNRGASIISYTASPRGVVPAIADEVYQVTTVRELLRDGYLVPPRIFAPDMPDFAKLAKVRRTADGEYSAAGLKKVWRPQIIFGRVLDNWQRLNPNGLPTALYAGGVANSLWFAQSFNARGVPAAHIDGEQIWLDGEFYPSDDMENRKQLLARLRDGRIKILCNCKVLEAGWDMPELAHIILAAPIGSRVTFVQVCGRGLRASPGKAYCTFQDHGGNFYSHPELDSDEPWDVTEKMYQAKRTPNDGPPEVPDPIACAECGALRTSGPECPVCGHTTATQSRYVVQVNGQLKLVTGPIYKGKKKSTKSIEQKAWERAYWGATRSGRTFSQAYNWARKQLDWAPIPTNLKFMPKRDDDWAKPISRVPFHDLY